MNDDGEENQRRKSQTEGAVEEIAFAEGDHGIAQAVDHVEHGIETGGDLEGWGEHFDRIENTTEVGEGGDDEDLQNRKMFEFFGPESNDEAEKGEHGGDDNDVEEKETHVRDGRFCKQECESEETERHGDRTQDGSDDVADDHFCVGQRTSENFVDGA